MNEKNRREHIAESLRALVRVYTGAMAQLESTLAVLCRELELEGVDMIYEPLEALRASTLAVDDCALPIVDRTMLSVCWRGTLCDNMIETVAS